jgi:hypothetical protein
VNLALRALELRFIICLMQASGQEWESGKARGVKRVATMLAGRAFKPTSSGTSRRRSGSIYLKNKEF